MNFHLLAKKMQRPAQMYRIHPRAVAWSAAVLAVLLVLASCMGFYWGTQYARSEAAVASDSPTSADQGATLSSGVSMPREMQETINTLMARLSALQAQVMRLNALGMRLVEKVGLEKGEFDFGAPPPQGGPAQPSALAEQSIPLPSLVHSVDALEQQLEGRRQQMNVLEMMFMNRNLLDEVLSGSRPVSDGWLSSFFGYRADPFTGRLAYHDGVDIAGRLGEPIVAVDAGVVTFSGSRAGFGNLVEVNHRNGFVTRYGHNSANLVATGDMVSKGQTVALMGSTGRSTGPHVHFEVWRNGQVEDPLKYLSAAN